MLIYVEARGECEDGQQAIAEVVLNRITSGLFGNSLTNLINDESQFVPRKLLKEAKPIILTNCTHEECPLKS